MQNYCLLLDTVMDERAGRGAFACVLAPGYRSLTHVILLLSLLRDITPNLAGGDLRDPVHGELLPNARCTLSAAPSKTD